jgi:hypothetical protein
LPGGENLLTWMQGSAKGSPSLSISKQRLLSCPPEIKANEKSHLICSLFNYVHQRKEKELGRIKFVPSFNCTLIVAGFNMELHAETVQILTSRLCNMMAAKSEKLYELFYELSERNWE